MNANDIINYDKKIYISILIFSISAFILFLIYFISIITYIKRNYNAKKLTLFWINYCIINFIVLLFLFVYILKLIIEQKERETNPDSLSSNFFSATLNLCLIMLVYTIIHNLIYDLINLFEAYHKLKKLALIKITEGKYLELQLKEIKLQNIFNQNIFNMSFIIFIIIHIGFLILYILGYVDINIDRTKGFLNISNFFRILIRDYYCIVFIAVIVYMILLSRSKKTLVNYNYYNRDLFEQKLFNIYSDKAIYYANILNYQFIVQLLLNIPILLFIYLKFINVISFVIFYISMFAYIHLGGTLYLNIDENNNAADCPSMVKKLFCFNNKTIFFRNKNIKDVFNDFIYHYDHNEKTKIAELEYTLFKKYNMVKGNDPQSNMYPLQTNDDKIFNSSRKLFNFDPNLINRNIIAEKRNNSDFPKLNAKTVIDFQSLCDYYILYKLLYLYFQENRDIYDNLFKKMNDDTNIFRKIMVESNPFRRKSSLGLNNSISNNAFGFNINKQDLITNIDRISRISIMDSKKIKTSLKVTNNDIFISLEEKDLFEEFKLKYGFTKNSDIDFKIESMYSDSFFEVIPYFQMKVDDIIKALMPSYNKKLFNIFIKKISPYKNKIEQNIFMTYNSLLIIEVYEKKEFISSENLKKFVNQYKTYLTNTLKNMDYTFLPLVIGIFNIQISGLSKIAVMYRNPLHFTLFNHFNNWITFYINESTEKLKASLMLDDVIDLNEIEVKNALKINEADYDEVKKNFKQDLILLKEVNLHIYPVVRLFIGDENGAIKAMDSNNLGFNKNYKITNMNEPSILDESTHKQHNISELLDMSDIGNLSLSKKISGDIFENDFNSILEKEYYSMSGNDIHTIKIYFTNLFRTGNELSRRKRDFLNDNKDDVSLTYRNFIEEELFNYLTKASSFLEDNEKKEKENNDIDIIIKKKMNLLEQNMIENENSSDSSDSEVYKRKKSSKNSRNSKKGKKKKSSGVEKKEKKEEKEEKVEKEKNEEKGENINNLNNIEENAEINLEEENKNLL